MSIIKLPIDTKSLYFNINNDNKLGHTPTVATPLKKVSHDCKMEDILSLQEREIDVSYKNELIDLLTKHSKTKTIIKKIYVFNNLTVNGIRINSLYSYGCYIKEEVDPTKVQFGRLKLHYPSKFVYKDNEIDINNKEIYRAISNILGNYAFLIRAFEYNTRTNSLNFDALIVGENGIPYSKVFINQKGTGNKFNLIFNEDADDYDKEIIALKKSFEEEVGPHNYLSYVKSMKAIAADIIQKNLQTELELIYLQYPYSLFDFCYMEDGIKKYGILRVTATKQKYFNISIAQQVFLSANKDIAKIFLITNVFENPALTIYKNADLIKLNKKINSLKYQEE